MILDTKIVNGLVVDGTGGAPYQADIGIAQGRIVKVGVVDEPAAEVVSASNRVVAPGFIDVHTHLDAQLLWDPMMSVSSWHGVTSVVVGNCGFGFAPTRPEHRELVMKTLENVEGMDIACLRAGLGEDWPFVSFPEYLAAIEASNPALTVGAFVPHSPLRLYVLGDDASKRAATPAEIGRMADLLAESLDSGGIGFSTSMHAGHLGANGLPIPSRLAEMDEFIALARVTAAYNGIFMAGIGVGFAVEQLRQVHAETGVRITFASITAGMGGRPDGHRRILAKFARALDDGVPMTAQVSCLPTTIEFNLADPMLLTHTAPSGVRANTLESEFAEIYREPDRDARLAIYSRPDFARTIRAATDTEKWNQVWSGLRIAYVPDRPELSQLRLTDYARQRGIHPAEALVGIAIESELAARFSLQIFNVDEDEVALLLAHPGTQVALSDAGAHVSQLCDACYPTHLLGHWVREKKTLTLEGAVRMLSGQPADFFKFDDRGTLEEGKQADVVIFDPEKIGVGSREYRQDLPGGASRIIVNAEGIDLVMAKGIVIRRDGKNCHEA